MPQYSITDPQTGRTLKVEGDSAPTEQEIAEIFAATSPKTNIATFVEPAITAATGAVAEPLAGLAGLASMPFVGAEEAAENVQRVRSALTYDPKTEEGQAGLQALASFLDPVARTAEAVSGAFGDVGYQAAGPVGGAVMQAVPTALMEALGVKGISRTRFGQGITGISDDVAAMAERNNIDVTDPANVQRLQELTTREAAEQARRSGLFEELGIPTTRSRVTQSQSDFLSERTLSRDPESPEGQMVQNRLIEESVGFKDAAQRLQDQLGIPDEAGDAIKEALESRLTGRKAAKNEAYAELAELSRGSGMPIAGDEIMRVFDDGKVRGMAGRLDPAQKSRVNDLMIEYGIDTDRKRVEAWEESRKASAGAVPVKTTVTPLSVLNAEEFRSALNDLIDPNGSKELNGVAGALIRGVDNELAELDRALEGADLGRLGKNTKDVIEASKRARGIARELFQEFSPKGLAGKLTSKQRGSFDRDLITSSSVAKKIIGGTEFGAVENVAELMDSLARSGPKGQKAIGDLQSAIVLDLMENATKARSAKLAPGVISWSGTNFAKRMDQIGSKKLRRIFANNPDALDMLENLREAGDLRTQLSAVAKSSGTADDMINFFQNSGLLSKISGLGSGAVGFALAQGAEGAAARMTRAANLKAARKQLNASPSTAQQVQQVKRLYPNMAVVLGIGQLHGQGNEE